MGVLDEESVLAEMKPLLHAIVQCSIPGLDDLRRVESLRHRIVHREHAGFYAIRAVVSDLDTTPDESRRHLFSENFLKQKDEESSAYLRNAAADIRSAAEALLSAEWMNAVKRNAPTDNRRSIW